MNKYLYKKKDDIYSNVDKIVVHFANGKMKIIYTPNEDNMLAVNVSEFKSSENNFIKIIHAHYRGIESIEEFSELCGFNSSKTFTRHFQKHLGTTPKQWLLQMKKRDVVQQLKSTSYPLSLIADNLGFSSASHLYHFCINKIGKTPSEIRSNK